MPLTIQVWDEAIHGNRSPAQALILPHAQTTARELIRTRIHQEREDPAIHHVLVQPEESEHLLNGIRDNDPVDRETQFLRACASFRRNGFLLFVDGVQITELDIAFVLHPASEVQFVKLVPLAG